MSRPRAPFVVALVAAAVFALPASAQDPAPRPFPAVAKDAKAAFKPLKLTSAKKLDKDLASSLPKGIVIESAPFDRLIERLRKKHADQLALRETAVREMAAHPGPKAGKVLRSALQTLLKDDAELTERIADVQDAYAEVFDQGYMAAGESVRRARKTAATLIPLYRGLRRHGATVRGLASESLTAFRSDESFTWLLALAGDRSPDARAVAAEALGLLLTKDAPPPEAAIELRRVLESDAVAAVRLTALCGLLRAPLADVRDSIVVALRDPAWEVRAVATAACVRGDLVEAAGPLIEALTTESGRLRTDIDDALFELLGVRYYADSALWSQWWADNADGIAKRAAEALAAGDYAAPLGAPETWAADGDDGGGAGGAAGEPDDKARRGATSAFYGISTRSRRVLFVIDISRSMESPAKAIPPVTGVPGGPYATAQGRSKLDIAKWQLHRAIHDLPDDARFGVVVYSESYALWTPGLSDAGSKAKKKAHKFVDAITANGTTNICDSLEAAFEVAGVGRTGAGRSGAGRTGGAKGEEGFAADTIFLLSDGNPNRGRLANVSELLADVVRRTARARLVIHAVGIGEVAGSPFLRELAERTGGSYVGFE